MGSVIMQTLQDSRSTLAAALGLLPPNLDPYAPPWLMLDTANVTAKVEKNPNA
jgi:hypothetical protein